MASHGISRREMMVRSAASAAGLGLALAVAAGARKASAEMNPNPDPKADNVQQSVTMAKPGKLYAKPDNKSAVVRDLDPGMTLYPSGEKQGIWWKVSDETGNEGWVPSPLFVT